jgi:RNA polymerase sigma factor (sigma-70 family)
VADELRSARVADWARRWNTGLTKFLTRRVGTRVDAQDLAQEVYLRLLRAERLDLILEPQAYLYKVASNVAAEWRIRACRSKPHSAEELGELIEATGPESLVNEALERARLDAALRRMNPAVRAVVYLKLMNSMSHDEIAGRLNITTRMVRRLLTTGYAQLRQYLIAEAGQSAGADR